MVVFPHSLVLVRRVKGAEGMPIRVSSSRIGGNEDVTIVDKLDETVSQDPVLGSVSRTRVDDVTTSCLLPA